MRYTPEQQQKHRDKLLEFMKALPERNFNIVNWMDELYLEDKRTLPPKSPLEGDCNTVCCAIGWCPTLFPDDWMWNTTSPQLINQTDVDLGYPFFNIYDDIFDFFGVKDIFFESYYRKYIDEWEENIVSKEDFIRALQNSDSKLNEIR